MTFHSSPRRAAVALLSAAGLLAGSGLAAAEVAPMALPGTDDSTSQMGVGGPDRGEVTVDAAGADATTVTGSFKNTSDASLSCRTLGVGGSSPAVTVTDAETVRMSIAYLSDNLLPPPSPMPGLNPGSMGVMLGSGSLGSLGLGDDAAVDMDKIQKAQDKSRVAGHYGTAPDFVVAAGASVDWTVTLTLPNAGKRTDFNAGALVTCEQGGNWFAFAGFEDDASNGGGGSLSMGSLGS